MRRFEIKMPDLGELDEVTVIRLLVGSGDSVTLDQPLIMVRSENDDLFIPSPRAGVIEAMAVRPGQKLTGSMVIALLGEGGAAAIPLGNVVLATVPVVGERQPMEVIELLVGVGDQIVRGQTLVTLEAETFLIEVPSEHTGQVTEVKVRLGDKIGEAGVILMVKEMAHDEVSLQPVQPKIRENQRKYGVKQ